MRRLFLGGCRHSAQPAPPQDPCCALAPLSGRSSSEAAYSRPRQPEPQTNSFLAVRGPFASIQHHHPILLFRSPLTRISFDSRLGSRTADARFKIEPWARQES
jgi:hypothetical protein